MIITIGESPRDDLIPLLNKYLKHVEIVQMGLLDNLNEEEMTHITNTSESVKVLVSRKNNGEAVKLNGELIEEKLENSIIKVADYGYDNILLLCTGEFNEINPEGTNLFIPDKIITPLIANIFPDKKMGLLIPNNSQASMMNKKWRKQNVVPSFEAASPYSNIDEIIKACVKLEKSGVDYILMDCMGYTEEMKEAVKTKVNIPVVLSNSLLLKILSEALL